MKIPVIPHLLLAVALVALASITPAVALAQAPSSAGAPAGSAWPTYGGNLYNQRYSSLDQITAKNVKDLKGAWIYHTNVYSQATSFESSPVVVGTTMYLTGPQSQVYALDAKDGKELWRYVPDMRDVQSLPLCCGQVNRGVAAGDGLVFVGQLDAKLTALDEKTGKVVWSIDVGDAKMGLSETMAPVYADGKVFIGISGAEYPIQGYFTAYDAKTGKQAWRFSTIPGPGETGHNTWPSASDIWKHGGGSVWQAPAIDPELGLIYITVGNPNPDLEGAQRAGDNLFTDSIVALDLKSGAYKWHFQEVHHDLWDYDTISPNLLFDTQLNGKTVKGIGEAGKTGWVYLLDRGTGKPLVGIDEKAVPQMAAQGASATQPVPVGQSFVPQACPEKIASYPMGSIFTPFGSDPVLICPGANGGSEWSPMSYSPQTDMVYVCGIHQPQIWTSHPSEPKPGELRLGSAFVTPPGGATWGTFTAIDVHTNTVKWQKTLDQMCIGGSLATAGGLVFAGEGNGNIDAFDASTGDLLWQFQTGAGVNAPPVTYEIDGTQYLAVAAGGNFQLDYPRGDALWVFSLKGAIEPVAAPHITSAVSAGMTAATGVDKVDIVDFGYAPGTITVPPGTKVTWTNTGAQPHTVTTLATDPATFDSGVLNNGQSFSFTFEKAGTYDYVCTLHPFMTGKVIVDPNAPPIAK